MPLAITPTFSPWTHTSDDSYIYQLSLVLATATVSLYDGLEHVYIWHVTFSEGKIKIPIQYVTALKSLAGRNVRLRFTEI